MDLTTLQLQPTLKKKKGLQMLKPVLSVGPDLEHLEADRNIPSDPLDNRKRRTIRLQKKNESWGFTIQTYGFKNKKTGEIEVYTYVDYVDLNGPASLAGMRRGDIILSVNGKSVEFATHQELVSVIQSCGNEARMVVFFVDCCKKVELHDRLIKLKRLLNDKIKELRNVEMKERELLDEFCLTRGMDRYDHSRQSIYSIQSNESSLDRISILTANSSTIYNLPNTATLHLNTSNSSSCISKSSNDDQSDVAEDDDMFGDVSFADDSDGDSGYSNDEFPHLQRKNTVIDRQKPHVQIRGRRGTLVAPVCECVEGSICHFCEARHNLDTCVTPPEEEPSQSLSECHDFIGEMGFSNPDQDQIPGSNDQSQAKSNGREEMTPTNPDQILEPNKNLANPDDLNMQEQCSHLLDQAPWSNNPDSNDNMDEIGACSSLPAGQETQHQESPEGIPDNEDWDFPFWTEGAICINLDDEKTKL